MEDDIICLDKTRNSENYFEDILEYEFLNYKDIIKNKLNDFKVSQIYLDLNNLSKKEIDEIILRYKENCDFILGYKIKEIIKVIIKSINYGKRYLIL